MNSRAQQAAHEVRDRVRRLAASVTYEDEPDHTKWSGSSFRLFRRLRRIRDSNS